MANEESKPPKKPYEKPTATELTREQAKLKLMGYAMMGDEQAKELLDILFQQENLQREKQPYERPTATELTREQAKLKLMGHAMMGSKQAKELLDMFFDNKKQSKTESEHKKSA
jgi:ribose 5-phosphate isomerase RpiB